MQRPPLVFLAHASEDKAVVRSLHHRLVQSGVRAWMDEVDLLPGQDWQSEIARVLAESDFVIACISRNSVRKNGYVQKELRTALGLQAARSPGSIYLIPVVLDGSEPPDLRIPELGVSLRNIQWLDLATHGAFDRLLRTMGCASPVSSAGVPVIEVHSDDIRTWPYKKACPKCDGGTLHLNHDTADYVCDKCEYWE